MNTIGPIAVSLLIPLAWMVAERAITTSERVQGLRHRLEDRLDSIGKQFAWKPTQSHDAATDGTIAENA